MNGLVIACSSLHWIPFPLQLLQHQLVYHSCFHFVQILYDKSLWNLCSRLTIGKSREDHNWIILEVPTSIVFIIAIYDTISTIMTLPTNKPEANSIYKLFDLQNSSWLEQEERGFFFQKQLLSNEFDLFKRFYGMDNGLGIRWN